jgi:tetratricopeptide (TPR) repeat protein
VRGALVESAQDARQGDLRPAIALMERQLAAVIALVSGQRDEAVAILRAAAQTESQLPLPLGLPEPIKPSSELLGEVLLELGRPAEAAEFFGQALRRNANRSLSVVGLARSAAASGDMDAARRHYRKLLTSFDQADADLPVLREARAALDGPARPRSGLSFRRAAVLVAVTLVGLAAAALLLQSKKRGPVARARKKVAAKHRR